jgi:hypothetical protein
VALTHPDGRARHSSNQTGRKRHPSSQGGATSGQPGLDERAISSNLTGSLGSAHDQ